MTAHVLTVEVRLKATSTARGAFLRASAMQGEKVRDAVLAHDDGFAIDHGATNLQG
jgi:hypothetical protein